MPANVERQAQAGRVQLSIRTDGRRLEVLVQDDGGMPGSAERMPAGYGLAAMQERIYTLGGEYGHLLQRQAGKRDTRQPSHRATGSSFKLTMIRIVIADDHTIMREGLKRILDGADDIEIVGEA